MNIAKIVREAREQTRLTALDFATGIFDDFVELHGGIAHSEMMVLLLVVSDGWENKQ